MKYGKTTCDANRPKDLEEYGFKVPERLRETLAPSSIVTRCSFGFGSLFRRRVCRLTDWETEFSSELKPETFSSPGTLQSLPRETRTPFSNIVKDLISLTLTEKKGSLEGLFILPRLILQNNMRGRTAVSKVLQNIGSFRKGMFKELWNMPNVVLRYGSFNPVNKESRGTG